MGDTSVIERPGSAELRESLLVTADALREMREKPEDDRSENWSRELRDSAHLVYAMDAELRVAELQESNERIEKMRLEGRGGAGHVGDQANLRGRTENRSIGQQIVESEIFTEWRSRSNGSGTSPDLEVRAPTVIAGDPYLIGEGSYLDANGSAGLWVPRGTPYLPTSAIDHRRLFVRDIMSSGSTTLTAIPYIREMNPRVYEEGATSVPEGTAKPEVSILFTQDLAPVRKIGAWVPVTTEILEDAPTLQSYIDARLGYMIQVREEEQIINGSGLNADIRGITQTPGIQTQAATAGDKAATIGNAIGLIESVDGDADGLAMNPIDFWSMMVTRHAQWFDGSPVASGPGLPYGESPKTVWGLPVVRSRSIASGQCVVGAWKTAAQIFDRTSAVIRVGDQHSDYFTLNKVAILIEERFALAVYRPDWFCLASV